MRKEQKQPRLWAHRVVPLPCYNLPTFRTVSPNSGWHYATVWWTNAVGHCFNLLQPAGLVLGIGGRKKRESGNKSAQWVALSIVKVKVSPWHVYAGTQGGECIVQPCATSALEGVGVVGHLACTALPPTHPVRVINCISHQIPLVWPDQREWDGQGMWHVSGERNACGVVLGKSKGRRQLGIRGLRWEDDIEMDLKRDRKEGMDWIHFARDRDNTVSWSVVYFEKLLKKDCSVIGVILTLWIGECPTKLRGRALEPVNVRW